MQASFDHVPPPLGAERHSRRGPKHVSRTKMPVLARKDAQRSRALHLKALRVRKAAGRAVVPGGDAEHPVGLEAPAGAQELEAWVFVSDPGPGQTRSVGWVAFMMRLVSPFLTARRVPAEQGGEARKRAEKGDRG